MLLAFVCSIGQAQVIQHNISDDGWAHVPLQFPFPLYGRVFTDSYMFSNGTVGFGSVNQGWCCSGYDLTFSRGPHLNYSILALQTDLINYGQGRFTSEGTTQYQRYRWENISEYGVPNNLNTFSLEIRPSGYIGINYEKVNISQWRPVTSGITGDTDRGEYIQFYHGPGFNTTTPYSYEVNATGNQCLVDPLFSPSCPGYQQAYFTQQCSISALYNNACPGYAEAYLAQQCSLDPLYATTCPGYTEAYFNQQCRANPLYDRTCPGYAEAYALAHVVPAPTVTVSTPTVQVSTTGTVAVETPVVSDPVVNEVITRPAATTTSVVATTRTVEPVSTQTITTTVNTTEKKTEEKKETKQEVKLETKPQTKQQVKVAEGKSIEVPTLSTPTVKIEQVQLVDLLSKQMISRPLNSNARAYYYMTISGQRSHEEMIDEQFRKRD